MTMNLTDRYMRDVRNFLDREPEPWPLPYWRCDCGFWNRPPNLNCDACGLDIVRRASVPAPDRTGAE